VAPEAIDGIAPGAAVWAAAGAAAAAAKTAKRGKFLRIFMPASRSSISNRSRIEAD
jgi:hypothetical protein